MPGAVQEPFWYTRVWHLFLLQLVLGSFEHKNQLNDQHTVENDNKYRLVAEVSLQQSFERPVRTFPHLGKSLSALGVFILVS